MDQRQSTNPLSRRKVLRHGGLAATALAAAGLTTRSVAAQEDLEDLAIPPDHPLIGSWVLVFPPDPSGQPVGPALNTYSVDGTAIQTGLLGEGQGAWRAIDERTGALTLVFLNTDELGTFAGTTKIRGVAEVGPDGNTFEALYTVEFTTPDGVVESILGPFPVAGTRIGVELIEEFPPTAAEEPVAGVVEETPAAGEEPVEEEPIEETPPAEETPVEETPPAEEETPPAEEETPPAEPPTEGEYAATVETYSFFFEPAEFTIPAETDVQILLRNDADIPHTFTIDPLGIDVFLEPAAEQVISFNAPAGTYTYVCTLHPDRMTGTMIVQ